MPSTSPSLPSAFGDDPPADPGRGDAATFAALMQLIALLAAVTHAAFVGLFLWAEVKGLALVNIGSLLSYALVFVLGRRQRPGAALAITVVEVVGHAIVATAVIGWHTGFHYYVLLAIPVVIMSPMQSLKFKGASVVMLVLTYLGMDILLRGRQAPFELALQTANGLHYFNVFTAMVILIAMAGYYYYLIDRAQSSLRHLARTDPLTQLNNRLALTEFIAQEQRRSRGGERPLSFIIGDLDHFKAVNDTHGHEVGDQVLMAVSQAMASVVRDVDHLGRWGGEEFLVVLPDADQAAAFQIAERLRQRVAAVTVPSGAAILKVSMTFGVSQVASRESAEQAIARADAALYDGKHGGRNRVLQALAS